MVIRIWRHRLGFGATWATSDADEATRTRSEPEKSEPAREFDTAATRIRVRPLVTRKTSDSDEKVTRVRRDSDEFRNWITTDAGQGAGAGPGHARRDGVAAHDEGRGT